MFCALVLLSFIFASLFILGGQFLKKMADAVLYVLNSPVLVVEMVTLAYLILYTGYSKKEKKLDVVCQALYLAVFSPPRQTSER